MQAWGGLGVNLERTGSWGVVSKIMHVFFFRVIMHVISSISGHNKSLIESPSDQTSRRAHDHAMREGEAPRLQGKDSDRQR